MIAAKRLVPVLALVLFLVAGAASADLTPKEMLGKVLYFDTNLSTPRGQACASCHHPSAGFADPDTDLPVSQGVLPKNRFGNRNSPSAAYAAFSPYFHFDEDEGLYVGGQFWDGRAGNLVEQAKGPFLNPLEMNNPSKLAVIVKIRGADYADLFEDVYGPDALDDVEMAYDNAADAIATYEATSELNQFSSKYDYYLAGMADLTEQEMRGLALYEDETRGNCAACHPSQVNPATPGPLFTDFTYDNLGVPRNENNPFYTLPRAFNPDGYDFVDYGLGGVLGVPEEMGKMKVPTVRNIAVTPPYMHNGVFATLHEVVDFYNTRDVGAWPPPEVPENVNHDELGDLGLTPEEVDDIVAFMLTLTDGFTPDASQIATGFEPSIPAMRTMLFQNVPNPFYPTTRIGFVVATNGHVALRVFDVSGRLVQTLLDTEKSAGRYDVEWDGKNLAGEYATPGVYFLKLSAGQHQDMRKAVFMK